MYLIKKCKNVGRKPIKKNIVKPVEKVKVTKPTTEKKSARPHKPVAVKEEPVVEAAPVVKKENKEEKKND